MTRSVLYLHGFASSPQSAKLLAIRPIVARAGITLVSPDLNVPSFGELSFESMVRTAQAAASSVTAAVVGSSLGSLVALEVVRRGLRVPLVLIAPALGIHDLWLERIPAAGEIRVMHNGFGREVEIHRPFFEEMSRIDADREVPGVPVTILIGDEDESVPFDGVRQTWERWSASGLVDGSAFIRIPGGDHSLAAHHERIAAEIVKAAGAEVTGDR